MKVHPEYVWAVLRGAANSGAYSRCWTLFEILEQQMGGVSEQAVPTTRGVD